MKKLLVLAILLSVLLIPVPADACGQAGTTLSATKTAAGFWERYIVYDWTLGKSVTPTEIEIKPGESGQVEYGLTATRTKVSETDKIGVRGKICVTNGGKRATENLTIVDVVQYKTGYKQYKDLVSSAVDVSAKPVLGPGERYCYPYEVTFTPVAGALYRNVAKVTITNHSGWLPGSRNCRGPNPCPFGPEPKACFGLPGSPTITETDAEADVTDVQTCPAGFACTPSDPGPWHFTDSGSVSFSKEIHNDSAPCDTYFNLNNTATLVEKDTGQESTASATVTIYTGSCPSIGCTRTQGYWGTHSKYGPAPYDPIWESVGEDTSFFTSGTTWYGAITTNPQGNGYWILSNQYVAAILNQNSGAYVPPGVQDTLDLATAWFNANNPSACEGSGNPCDTQKGWAGVLDDYNNGIYPGGPPHCD